MAEKDRLRPIVTNNEGDAILNPGNTIQTDALSFNLDANWTRNAFLVNDTDLGNVNDIANRYWSSADARFVDTRLGCNIGINPKPQRTRYSDIRRAGRTAGRNKVTLTNTLGNYGMGRYYDEAFETPSQTIYMSFGVEQFNALTNFLRNAFSGDLISLAKTGRATSAFYSAGKVVGTITAVVAFPAVAAFVAGFKVLNFLFSRPTYKYYTVKKTMGPYWGAVNSLVNNFAINSGLFPKIMNPDSTAGQRLGQPYVIDQGMLDELSRMMPDVFPHNSDGESKNYFDVYQLANRAQRQANLAFINDYNKLNEGTASDFTGYLNKELTGNGSHSTYISTSSGQPTFASYINRLLKFSYYFSDSNDPKAEIDPRIDTTSEESSKIKDPSFFTSFLENIDAEFRDGSQFAVFKVNHTGPVSESFSNAVVESSISQKLNSISSDNRTATFALAGGNIIGGVAGAAVGTITKAVADVALGALDGVTMGFSNLLPGLGGGGYIDIPKHWQSSTADLPRIQYTMHLSSPYGNLISRIINVWIPYFMVFAGAMPRSTGKASYTGPFLCQIYDRGRNQIKTGIIESISVTRGSSHLAFDTKGNALALDVSFTVADCSSILHMPISTGSIFSNDVGLDEDNILSDYMATLAGQDLYSQMYAIPKAKLKAAKTIASLNKLTSPGYWASMVHDATTSGLTSVLTLGVGYAIEGAVRQSETSVGSIN